MRCADTYYDPARTGVPAGVTGAEVVPSIAWSADVPFNPDAPVAGEPLLVRGNHGRWVVECDHCTSAQLASQADPRFMCVGCGNGYQSGAWRPVEWPTEPEVLAVLLDERPRSLANWEPGETVDDIEAENALLAELAAIEAEVTE